MHVSMLLGFSLASAVACVQPSVRNIIAPDGTHSLYITCSESGQCYQLAGKHCPHGYNIQRAGGAVPPGYIVSCRRQLAPAPQAYAPYASAAAPTPPPAPNWQPAPAPSVDAWGQPLPATANHTPPPTDVSNGLSFPRPIGDEMDIGY